MCWDPKEDVRDYEFQVATAFPADAACHGFRLIGVHGPVKAEDTVASQWQLMFDYDPGEAGAELVQGREVHRKIIRLPDVTDIPRLPGRRKRVQPARCT